MLSLIQLLMRPEYNWLKEFGPSPGQRKVAGPMNKVYSSTFKAQVVLELLEEEKSLAQVSSEHGLHVNVLRKWNWLPSKVWPRSSSAGTT